jgi:hypothetical protein
MATKWVRVKDKKTRHEYTVADVAVRDGEQVLDNKDAVDLQGNPLPGKPHLNRGQRTAEDTSKENA